MTIGIWDVFGIADKPFAFACLIISNFSKRLKGNTEGRFVSFQQFSFADVIELVGHPIVFRSTTFSTEIDI